MTEDSQNKSAASFRMNLLQWVLRVFIGGILLGSAVGKALDFGGFIEVLKTYQVFPPSMLILVAVVVTGSELFLGLWILSGWQLVMSALAAAGMNLVYAAWMTVTLLRGLELSNCGCFGVFFPRPLTWSSPIEDLVIVALCGVLAYLAKALDSPNPRMQANSPNESVERKYQ